MKEVICECHEMFANEKDSEMRRERERRGWDKRKRRERETEKLEKESVGV